VSEYQRRLEAFERRLRVMEADLAALRAAAPAEEAEEAAPVATLLVDPAAAYEDLFAIEPEPAPVPPREARRSGFDFAVPELLGARTLAATGGVVTLLGIVFFFALAVERGWIGPGARVTLGAIASALALGAGWWLRRRFD
jgi:uncharacterized membrane protein